LSLERLNTNDVIMTQEMIANMLGVRRAGVTVAAKKLQEKGLISYRYGQIKVLDRSRLLAQSCECYDTVKKVYDDLGFASLTSSGS